MDVKEIIKEYLEKNDFTGLIGDSCGCEIEDLIPCGEDCSLCKPGYKVDDETGEYDFIITTQKPE